MMQEKAERGRFFEDFEVGQLLTHPVPRTLTHGDRALYTSLYPDRRVITSSDLFARACGLPEAPLHDLALFHIVFGKSVPDISLNAIANLGYASCRFHRPVFAGDTISAKSLVLGKKENSSRKSGIVWVRTTGLDRAGETVLEFVRWVMVAKRNPDSPTAETIIPECPDMVAVPDLPVPAGVDFMRYDFALSGEPHRLGDYRPGEMINHIDGVTVEEAEHMMATRLWQNNARVHFNAESRKDGRRLIYGGHIMSLARALTCNGLANAQLMLAMNAGAHLSPCFAGDTVRAWSHVVEIADSAVPGAGAIRLRTIASRSEPGPDHDDSDTLLDIDYWALMPL